MGRTMVVQPLLVVSRSGLIGSNKFMNGSQSLVIYPIHESQVSSSVCYGENFAFRCSTKLLCTISNSPAGIPFPPRSLLTHTLLVNPVSAQTSPLLSWASSRSVPPRLDLHPLLAILAFSIFCEAIQTRCSKIDSSNSSISLSSYPMVCSRLSRNSSRSGSPTKKRRYSTPAELHTFLLKMKLPFICSTGMSAVLTLHLLYPATM
jgi:hypothetical protein